jgi:hypothetical protein
MTDAAASAAGKAPRLASQLPRGKRPHTENGGHHRRQQKVFDRLPAHESFSRLAMSFFFEHGC